MRVEGQVFDAHLVEHGLADFGEELGVRGVDGPVSLAIFIEDAQVSEDGFTLDLASACQVTSADVIDISIVKAHLVGPTFKLRYRSLTEEIGHEELEQLEALAYTKDR